MDSKAFVRWWLIKYSKTWIIVTQLSDLLLIRVSPQSPMICVSCFMTCTMRDRLSGYTFVSASTMSTISNMSGVALMRWRILLNMSNSREVIRSSNIIFDRKFIRTICESRFPRLPGFGAVASCGVPHLTTRIVGTQWPSTLKWPAYT